MCIWYNIVAQYQAKSKKSCLAFIFTKATSITIGIKSEKATSITIGIKSKKRTNVFKFETNISITLSYEKVMMSFGDNFIKFIVFSTRQS